MDYMTLTLSEVAAGLEEAAADAVRTFGPLDARDLNWKPAADSWSIAQCLDHLLKMNQQMTAAKAAALDERTPRRIWQRLPVWPRLFGSLLVRSQGPGGTRKFKAPATGQPAASDIGGNVVERFAAQQREMAAEVRRLDESRAAATIMMSPFASVVSYSVLDGWRLVLAHDHRHLEQARRVLQLPVFPGADARR